MILPINENRELFPFPDSVARLFLYYPLIGSEDFGFNFVINCKQFLPTEPRDGIHLNSNKDQVQEQEEANQKIIERASQLIFDFLKSDMLPVSNPMLYAQINFKRNTDNNLLNEYFEKLQSTWIDEFKLLPIVETIEGFKPVNEVCFFDEDLRNKEIFDDIYTLVSQFYTNIPKKDKVVSWSKFANEWDDTNTKFIVHEELAEKISKEELSKFDNTCLINYYKHLIVAEKINYFDDYNLLPNLDGKFYSRSSLRTPENLTDTLINIGKHLIPESIEKIIHHDFCFDKFHFKKFNRKDFQNEVKNELDEIDASTCIYFPETVNKENFISESLDNIKKLEDLFFENLLKYCKLDNNTNSDSKPSKLVKIISKYYSFDKNLIELPKLEAEEENLDIRSSRKILVQIFFNLLECHNEDWVKSNIDLLFEIANCQEDSLKDAYSDSKIYPNQIYQLKSKNELKRDIDIIPDIKDLYNKVTEKEIRNVLVNKKFNEFIDENSFIKTKYLTNEIEEIFFAKDINNINEHSFKVEILNIINSLEDKKYAELFPRLNDKKANIMLEAVTNEKTKDAIFSLVTLEESELKKLGKLVKEKNFFDILNTAGELLQQQKETDADFDYKYKIGIHIESLIREKLSDELKERISFEKNKTEVTNKQGGQDIIIYFDKNPVYFIEVKSRWNSKSSVFMSKLQLQRAVEKDTRYALCAVDITQYKGESDIYKLSTDKILPLTKFVTNIGSTIKPLIKENLEAEKEQDKSIHLIDYKGIIPQDIIKRGDDFENFIKLITEVIFKMTDKKTV